MTDPDEIIVITSQNKIVKDNDIVSFYEKMIDELITDKYIDDWIKIYFGKRNCNHHF